jgi:hypothetical protein
VQIDQDSDIKIHTANGVVDGKRGRAATVQLRSLQTTVACAAQRPIPTTMSSALAGNGLAPSGSSEMAPMPPCHGVLPVRPSCCSVQWRKQRRSRAS